MLIGIAGACRCDELLNLTVSNIEDMGDKLLITMPVTKTKRAKSFVVSEYLDIFRKYASQRPSILTGNRFFFKYFNGKPAKQTIGIHKFGSMPREIATYLQLPHEKEYTGHCFRRTSATLLVNSGADLLTLKRHGGWKSSTVAEGYVDDSLANKSSISKRILTDITDKGITSNVNQDMSNRIINLGKNKGEGSSIVLENCSNFNVNIYNTNK